MKTLSVRQPWAAAIAHFGKHVENRSWYTRHRGTLAVHASVKLDGGGDSLFHHVAHLSGQTVEAVRGISQAQGAVIAVARLTGVCSASLPVKPGFPLRCPCGPWAVAGQRHFLLTDVRALAEPVPASGSLGVWELPEEVEAAVRAQLGAEVRHAS